jgi:hypothetical protein
MLQFEVNKWYKYTKTISNYITDDSRLFKSSLNIRAKLSKLYRVPTMLFYHILGSKELRYRLIIDKYQSHNAASSIEKINTLLSEHHWFAPTVACEVA